MGNTEINFGKIKEAIIKVIAFFDLFDYALTDLEIWRILSVKCELRQVVEALENAIQPPSPPLSGGVIESKNGFYFLAGRSLIIEERLRRYNFTDRKFKRALLASKIFRFIPWLKLIAVGNLLGAHNLRDESDIDFFIVTEDQRLWLTRFFCAGLAKLLGLRPRAGNSRDKICLSFYASEWAMDLSSVMLRQDSIGRLSSLQNDSRNYDIYFTYWLAGLTPLYDAGGAYQKLFKTNQWLLAGLPNWRSVEPVSRRRVKPLVGGFYRDLMDLLFGGLEPQFKALQLKLLPPRLKNLMNRDSRVVVNDSIIKLHANDRREEYGTKYLEKINKLL